VQRAAFLTETLPGLTSGELPARLRGLTPAGRRTLLAIALAGLATRKGRYWIAAGHPHLIPAITMRALRKGGFVGNAMPARLTPRGQWCARTIVTEIGNQRAEERAICHAEF